MTIISWFGQRGGRFHKGLDIKAPMETPVMATADGVVTLSRVMRGYGQVVAIDHGDGFETRYAHLCRRSVEPGQHVYPGDQVGLLGCSGNATTPHVHYEVRYEGEALNPLAFLPAD